jgi:hypothetical protein
MTSDFLTTTSSMICPHGGTVIASTSNTRVKADGQYVLRSTDTFTIAGCTFKIGTVPHPCTTVSWEVDCAHHTSARDPSLTKDSVGLCLAADEARQGVVQITSTQNKAGGT